MLYTPNEDFESVKMTIGDVPEKASNIAREGTRIVLKTFRLIGKTVANGVGVEEIGLLAEIYTSIQGAKGSVKDMLNIFLSSVSLV